MLSAHLFEVICFSILIVESIWIITVEIRRYKKRKAELDSYANAIKFQPLKLRFVVSALSYGIIPSIPLLLLFWWYMVVQDMWIGLLGVPFLVLIGGMPSAYPYYTILIHEGKLKGPTLWGWRWRQEEIEISEIDKEKTLRRNIGGKLGILIFYSFDGKKILSLGLDESQIQQILDTADTTENN